LSQKRFLTGSDGVYFVKYQSQEFGNINNTKI